MNQQSSQQKSERQIYSQKTIHERFIFVYDSVLPKERCDRIIELFEQSPDRVPGKTSSGISPKKKSMELYIDPMEEKWKAIDSELFQMYSDCSKDYFSHFPWLNHQYRDVGYFIKRYEKGSGFFKNHIDASTIKNSKRFLVLLLYLNTVETGGETEFTHLDLKVSPVAGRLLIFPPMWMYPHQALVPRSNHKYTVNTFFTFTE